MISKAFSSVNGLYPWTLSTCVKISKCASAQQPIQQLNFLFLFVSNAVLQHSLQICVWSAYSPTSQQGNITVKDK